MIVAAIAAIATMTAVAQPSSPERPRLVVGIVVDQMRWDYLYTYNNIWAADGGFNRLLAGGYSCANTMIDYMPTVTACGHASIYTGTTPAWHGIAGNNFLLDGVDVASVTDANAHGVGSDTKAGQVSPRNLLATTIGDQIKLATCGKAIVAGVSLKDRAAVLPAGHSADLALWYDNKAKRFITSDYYTDKLPQWVTDFNRENKAALATNLWDEPQGTTMTTQLAIAALNNLQMGRDDVTDLLAVSYSTTDACAHNHGIRTDSVNAIYRQLDRELATLLDALDSRVGKGNYLLFLTADHGGTYNINTMQERNLPGYRTSTSAIRRRANEALQRKFGIENLIKTNFQYSFYLDNDAIRAADLDRDDVAAEACRALMREPLVQWAVDIENINASYLPAELRERIAKGYARDRSGDIHVILRPLAYTGAPGHPGSAHGTFTQSDSHIPLVFYGWGITAGETTRLTHMTDIAPTVCALLHMQAPNCAIGQPIF